MYNQAMACEDNGAGDYEAEYAQWLHDAREAQIEYDDAVKCGFYKRQHALPFKGNNDNGVFYIHRYVEDNEYVIPVYRVEE